MRRLQNISPRSGVLLLALLTTFTYLLIATTRHAPSQLAGLNLDLNLSQWQEGKIGASFDPLRAVGWDHWVSGVRKSVLVIGGTCHLGLNLLPSLLETYHVHILDSHPRPASLPTLPRIQYYETHQTSLSSLISSNRYAGVIHLGGLAREGSASTGESEGNDLQWTEELFQPHAKGWWRGKSSAPWVLLASNAVVRPDGPDERQDARVEDRAEPPTNEELLKEAIHGPIGSSGTTRPVNRIALVRLGTIYGYPPKPSIPPSLIDTLLLNSVISSHVQFDSAAVPLDLIHFDNALVGLTSMITRLEAGERGMEEIDLVSGTLTYPSVLLDKIRQMTSSKGSVRDISTGREMEQTWITGNPTIAQNVLGWAPADLDFGLRYSIAAIHQAGADWAHRYLSSHCPDSTVPSRPSPGELVSNMRNRDMGRLAGCRVNIAFNRQGYLDYVKCQLDSEPPHSQCSIDNERVKGLNWGQSAFIVREIPGRKGRAVRVKLEEEAGRGWLALDQDRASGLRLAGVDEGWQAVFDLEVEEDGSALRLLEADTGMQLRAMTNTTINSTFIALESLPAVAGGVFDVRLDVLCCPLEGDWPLLLDDYESTDIRFGTTGQIPFNASRRAYTCQRAEEAYRWNDARLGQDRLSVNDGDVAKTSRQPHDWALKELPVCWNDCTAPTVCVQTGACRCVQAECASQTASSRSVEDEDEASGETNMGKSVLGIHSGPSPSLVQAVAKRDWKDLLLPSFRTYLANTSFPSLHVVTGYPNEAKIESAECHKLGSKHCFSADSILYRAMRMISVPAHEADLIVIPVYQHCDDASFALHKVMNYAMETIPAIKEGKKKLALALTHDWGICIDFAWEVWEARDNHRLYPDWILNNVLVWSVMGDYDSPCYRPHQDVVIPARTCLTKTLKKHFGDMINVVPARERKKLVTWSGTFWGTGKSERLRLTCDRGGAGERELVKGGGAQSSWMKREYMDELASARFCPQPRGIAGWSPRTSDAIYAGCIPVITAEGSHYPFSGFLDWSKFSVRILPTQLDSIERILESIPIERVTEMQENLMLIRDAMIYSDDESPEDELDRRGPMFWALHAAGLRMGTEYPIE